MHLLNKKEVLQYIAERADLFDECATQNCFTGSAWLLHFVDQITHSSSRFVVPEYLAEGGESTMLLYSPNGRAPLRALSNYYSSLYSPICTRSREKAIELGKLVRQLSSEPIIDFSPLSLEDADILREQLAQDFWYAKEYYCFGNWIIRTHGLGFEQYMKQRPSQLRNTWIRKQKKFKGEARIEIFVDEARQGIGAFRSVYAKSWKKPEPYPDFVPGWARICASRKTLRLGVAWVGDKPIAAQFWFVENKRANIFKLAYDEEYASWSAGTVLTAALMRHVLDVDQVETVDFLTGDDEYKKSWMNERLERVGILACNLRTFRGIARGAYEFLGSVRKPREVPTPERRPVGPTGTSEVS